MRHVLPGKRTSKQQIDLGITHGFQQQISGTQKQQNLNRKPFPFHLRFGISNAVQF
jgi:hypothetical protein